MSELEAMLLDYDNKELIISSDKLAELTGVQHRSLTKQINKYLSDLKSFGAVVAVVQHTGENGRPRKIYKLNEHQALLMVMYMKDTPRVAEFKVEFIKRLHELREKRREMV